MQSSVTTLVRLSDSGIESDLQKGGESPPQKSDHNEPNIAEKRPRLELSASIIIPAVLSSAENSATCQRESDLSSGGSGSTPIVAAAGTGSSSTSPPVAAPVAPAIATAIADKPPCAPSEPRPLAPARRTRTAFTRRQLECMESLFDAQPYPDKLLFDQLSHVLALDERVLQIWFQNRRARKRRDEQEVERDEAVTQVSASSSAALATASLHVSPELHPPRVPLSPVFTPFAWPTPFVYSAPPPTFPFAASQNSMANSSAQLVSPQGTPPASGVHSGIGFPTGNAWPSRRCEWPISMNAASANPTHPFYSLLNQWPLTQSTPSATCVTNLQSTAATAAGPLCPNHWGTNIYGTGH